MALNLSSVKADLRRKYVCGSKEEIDRTAKLVYDVFRENLQADITGAYGSAFSWAEKSGIITKKPEVIEDEKRKEFALTMRATYRQDIVRRLAAAGDRAEYELRVLDSSTPQEYARRVEEIVKRSLVLEGLEGFCVNRTPISFNQLRVLRELVFEGKYGGLRNNGKPASSVALTMLYPKSLPRPEGYFPFVLEEPSKQDFFHASMDDAIRESDRAALVR